MKRELKQAWLEKLRSGEIQKGLRVLENRDGAMCCLGVLCSIAIPERRRTDIANRLSSVGYKAFASDVNEAIETSVLPHDLADSVDMDRAGIIPNVFVYRNQSASDEMQDLCLATINDFQAVPFTFPQIADVIEYFIPEEA